MVSEKGDSRVFEVSSEGDIYGVDYNGFIFNGLDVSLFGDRVVEK